MQLKSSLHQQKLGKLFKRRTINFWKKKQKTLWYPQDCVKIDVEIFHEKSVKSIITSFALLKITSKTAQTTVEPEWNF